MGEIIQKNLELMVKDDFSDGSFKECICSESLGGNAGSVTIGGKEYSCGGANFVYDTGSGQILYFGNSQNFPEKIKEKIATGKAKHSTFRVAVKFGEDISEIRFRIVEHYFNGKSNNPAVRTILESVNKYNTEYGFD
ncbi:MAG: hypothetical protein AABX65_03165 [Nanoarchaeota archaeon]